MFITDYFHWQWRQNNLPILILTDSAKRWENRTPNGTIGFWHLVSKRFEVVMIREFFILLFRIVMA